jgi:membrane protein implicated in regulation of membrane protease activity
MRTKTFFTFIMMMVLFIGIANTASAYVGPGAGLSLLGALWGLVLAVGAALWFVIIWPLRRMRKRSQQRRDDAEAAGTHHGDI